MKIYYCIFILLITFRIGYSQQIPIPRIELMSNYPASYKLKDWKKTALDYDDFVFNLNRTGEYLPLVNINPNEGTNYSEINHIRMDTYVGQNNHGKVAEAINIIPAIVGASLVGRDKTTHFDTNWVSKVKDFFNLRNGQHIYLNNYSANTGNDWWYETMPNVFFYQLMTLYPNVDADFDTQFTTVADRWLDVVFKLGGTLNPWQHPDMNYRAFNLLTGKPNATGVPEPEAAGAIAWILYQAYKETGNIEYRYGAELALDFLQNLTTNPSYEIQLPYGILTAAQMNAVEGTDFDMDKMLNWAFSSGKGTLRGWGCIAGEWSGCDMSGLIGEANDNGNDYAFIMNGFQHAAALAPLVKYDKRYARAIAKWIVNLASASRYFYRDGLPPANQEQQSYEWALQFDENVCIPYEAIKENWNDTKPCAMGDAVKGSWAATNLSLYSGSHVGYLAALIDSTNVDGILQINLNKTDFRGDNPYPAYLYYNPYPVSHSVDLDVGTEAADIYDAISEAVIKNNVRGIVSFEIEADNVCLPVIYPTGNQPEADGRILKINDNDIIDYHYRYDYVNKLRVKVLSSDRTRVVQNEFVEFRCQAENISGSASYEWYANDELIYKSNEDTFKWKAPDAEGEYLFLCKVVDSQNSAWSGGVAVDVIDAAYAAPEIKKIDLSGSDPHALSSEINVDSEINNVSLTSLEWSITGGSIEQEDTLTPLWILPDKEGIYEITLTVSNASGSDSETRKVLVKKFDSVNDVLPVIYYPFNGDTENHAQNSFHAVSNGAVPASDARGVENSAYKFASANEYIYLPNEPALNFQDKIAISFWIKPDYLPDNESFIVSHGSWEERYKISVNLQNHRILWHVFLRISHKKDCLRPNHVRYT